MSSGPVPNDPVAKIVMIEDQVSYGDAFGLALSLTDDLAVVARASDGRSGIELVNQLQPDMVVCDYRLPDGETGAWVAQQLRASGFENPIALLTGFLAPQVRREAADLENTFAMSKDSPVADIVETLRRILSGDLVPENDHKSELSPGELEVLELLNQGKSPSEIAGELYLSLHTIRARIKSMHRKLNVVSQVEALAVATRRGLLVPPQ